MAHTDARSMPQTDGAHPEEQQAHEGYPWQTEEDRQISALNKKLLLRSLQREWDNPAPSYPSNTWLPYTVSFSSMALGLWLVYWIWGWQAASASAAW
jgi:hypothetical protein